MISRLELYANMTQMFSATSVGVLLHPNSDRKWQNLWIKKPIY